MKSKRIISILLAAVMLFSSVVLSGCSGSNSEEDAANSTSTREITTVNMYILTEDTTTQEAASAVELEINRILLPEYKTMLKINYLTADEYWDVVDGVIEETDPENDVLEDGSIDPDSLIPATIKGTENLSFNQLIDFLFDENNPPKLEITKPQIDIFVVDNYDKYVSLAEDGKIIPLNSYLDYDSKILSKYIYPTFMSAASIGKDVYGIPTNKPLSGEYTYMVFNKDLLDKYGYEVKDLTVYSGNKFKEYLGVIKANEPGIWPVNGVCDIAGAEMYDNSFITIAAGFNAVGTSSNASFMETRYMDHLNAIVSYEELGYYPAVPSDNYKYAIEIEKSDKLEEVKQWQAEDGTTYVRYLYDIPRITVEDAFSSMMCVSASSPVPDRAMEMITLFHTDSELANLLQYGIKGINYTYNEFEDSISPIGNSYSMDNYVTGNTYIKFPPENDHDYVEKAKKANLNTAPSSLLGFTPVFSSKSEQSDFECVKAVLQTAQQAVLDGRDINEVRAIINKELVLLGYGYAGITELAGIFGKMQSAQAQQSKVITKNFGVSEEIIAYNEPYGIYLEAVVAEPEVEENAEGEETAEGEEAEGEAAEGEEQAAAE